MIKAAAVSQPQNTFRKPSYTWKYIWNSSRVYGWTGEIRGSMKEECFLTLLVCVCGGVIIIFLPDTSESGIVLKPVL